MSVATVKNSRPSENILREGSAGRQIATPQQLTVISS
jgi:hypothetical protein